MGNNKIKLGDPIRVVLLFLVTLIFTGCKSARTVSPILPLDTETPTSLPTLAPNPTSTPTPTVPSVYLPATVWTQNPQVPILIFHRFVPPRKGPSDATRVLLTDFQTDLQELYDAGYSMVSLQDWIEGNLSVPPGRKPLVITIDDAFFADQISLDANGIPLENTGLGILWRFAQLHPDFGFKASLFVNLGDKFYGNLPYKDWFLFDDHWRQALGNVIAWCLDHNIGVYNHLYSHPRLDLTKWEDVHYEVAKNDSAMRDLLTNSGHEGSIKLLHNIIALPYGIWPSEKTGVRIILEYVDPEGRPVEAIFEAESYTEAGYLQVPYSKIYDPMHIPRINGSLKGVNFVIQQAPNFPAAKSCLLGPMDPSVINEPKTVENEILRQIHDLNCPYGVYSVAGKLYESTSDGIHEINLRPLP